MKTTYFAVEAAIEAFIVTGETGSININRLVTNYRGLQLMVYTSTDIFAMIWGLCYKLQKSRPSYESQRTGKERACC